MNKVKPPGIFVTVNSHKMHIYKNGDALRLANLTPSYILMSHSMSGLEALIWTIYHPDEVEVFIFDIQI